MEVLNKMNDIDKVFFFLGGGGGGGGGGGYQGLWWREGVKAR